MSIVKLDFSIPFLDPKGRSIGQTVGETVSTLLMQSPAKPPLSTKYFGWGLELVKSGIIEMDEVDKKGLIELINNSDNLTVISKGRILEVLDPQAMPLPAPQLEVVEDTSSTAESDNLAGTI